MKELNSQWERLIFDSIILLLAKYFVQKYLDFKNNLVSQNSGGYILSTQIANL